MGRGYCGELITSLFNDIKLPIYRIIWQYSLKQFKDNAIVCPGQAGIINCAM